MIEGAILTAVAARLAAVLAPPAGRYWPLCVGATVVGWLDAARKERLRTFPEAFDICRFHIAVNPKLTDCAARTAAISAVTHRLAEEGALSAWRNELYAVAAAPDDEPVFLLERAAARYFGVRTFAVHVNGLTRRNGMPWMWIARRSPAKAIDPGQLDNLVGGGIAAGFDTRATVIKEAAEEAGIPPDRAARATAQGELSICRAQPDGLQREVIRVHDLELPASFVPRNEDGEVAGYRLVAPDEAARLVALRDGADVVTADASLVIADWLLRSGYVAAGDRKARRIAALRHAREPRAVGSRSPG